MLSLERMRQQCRLDSDNTAEDDLLQLYAQAAKAMIENITGRVLYALDAVPDPLPANGAPIDAGLELAGLLLVAHWHRHREAVTDVAKASLPLAFDALVMPYRWITL